MTCRHVNLGGVSAIVCDRAKPLRVHWVPNGARVIAIPVNLRLPVACGANARRATGHLAGITCRACRKRYHAAVRRAALGVQLTLEDAL